MEAVIYEESPLADYLEGDATHFEPTDSTPSTPQYAPTGLPRVRDRLRALRDTAKSVASLSDERALERFRYIFVASQLLSDEPNLRTRPPDDDSSLTISLSLRGALFAIGLSFFVPWLLHWIRARIHSTTAIGWSQLLVYLLVAVCTTLFLIITLRRQYARFIRQRAISSASSFISESNNFDTTISAALRHVQEIEVVARGYQISYPLPPISRLDDLYAIRHCRELRTLLAKSLTMALSQFVHFHNELQPFVSLRDLNNYHHIYEISADDFGGAINFANELSSDAQETLKQLRFLVSLHTVARKLLLIDLLALRPRSSWSDVHLWRRASRILCTLTEDSAQAAYRLESLLKDEEQPDAGVAPVAQNEELEPSPTQMAASPAREQSKAQVRRFEVVASAVRSLNVKVRIARDDISELIANNAGEATISSAIAKHYESMGADLRSLLVDWERGRNAMLLHVDQEARYSRPSSGTRSPMSPSPSLGGVTMVDGGPADALRLLNGEEESHTGALDQEVFEAVAKPRKRMSLALSREEKMAKLQEDRRKRATLQDQAETTTNMLRELQMVIKHRPQNRPHPRVTSV